MNAVDMNSIASPRWRELYLAAIFETKKSQIPLRIRTAEEAIAQRSRQLFALSSSSGERNSLASALVALHPLRVCIDDDAPRCDRKAA